ncbi:hypothetical protein B0A52_04382 [Exophiala mesophila]|uniref:Isochorismatase-like domain-containing protein n=1 Tax=Exophiala mesophila TaxID=212818 RepID=A0A438N9B8_EXOME|nr:hypothetical protein B0A52_04382 [Exophiala mesophila]
MSNSSSFSVSTDKSTPGSYGPSETALVLLDFHSRFVNKAGGPGAPGALQVASELRSWANSKGIQVINCLLDVSQSPSPTFKGVERYGGVIELMRSPDGGAEVPATLLEGSTDHATFTRKPGTGSAFCSPGFHEFLKTKGIKSLILTGLPTSGAVARTAFAAGDADLVVTIVSDACTDPQQNVHDLMLESVLGGRCWVTTSEVLQAEFGSA